LREAGWKIVLLMDAAQRPVAENPRH
jgi:hypothetical protein